MSEHCGWRGRFDWWPVDVLIFAFAVALMWFAYGGAVTAVFATGTLAGYWCGRTAHD